MTPDLRADLGRHQPETVSNWRVRGDSHVVCCRDGDDWPCDAARALADLSEAAKQHDLAEQAKGAEAEAATWRRIPGSYRLEDGSLEVIVPLPESLSFLRDEFPDEVGEVARLAAEAERERLRARAMPLRARVERHLRLNEDDVAWLWDARGLGAALLAPQAPEVTT